MVSLGAITVNEYSNMGLCTLTPNDNRDAGEDGRGQKGGGGGNFGVHPSSNQVQVQTKSKQATFHDTPLKIHEATFTALVHS